MFWRQMANESIREMLSDTPQIPSDAKVISAALPLGRCIISKVYPACFFVWIKCWISPCVTQPICIRKIGCMQFGLIRECVYHHVCHIYFVFEAPSLVPHWMYMCFHFAPERWGSTSDNTQEQERGEQRSPPRVSALTTALEHVVQSTTGGGKEGGAATQTGKLRNNRLKVV